MKSITKYRQCLLLPVGSEGVCLLVRKFNRQWLKFTKYSASLFCMGVEPGRPYYGTNRSGGRSIICRWGRQLGITGETVKGTRKRWLVLLTERGVISQEWWGKVIYKNQLDATITIYWSPRSAQHVSGHLLPIFRSARLRFLQHMVSCPVVVVGRGSESGNVARSRTGNASKQSAKPVAVYTVLDSWWWTENLSETCRGLFQK